MKKILCLTLIIIFSNLVLAEDFSGYKYEGDKFTLNGDNFSIQLSNDEKTLYIRYNSDNYIIPIGECVETKLNYYYICYEDAVVDFHADPEIGKLHDRTGEIMPGLKISLSYKKPDIMLTRSFSKTNPLVNEMIKASVTITNNGKNPAQISYTDPIPEGFEVKAYESAGYDGENILYSSNMGMGAVKKFYYTLKPLTNLSTKFTGNLSYTYEDFKGIIKNTETTLTTPDTVTMSISSPSTLNIDQEGRIVVTIKNLDPETIAKFNLTIEVPKDLIVKSTSEELVEDSFQKYSFKSNFEKLEQKEIEIEILTTITGENKIPIKLSNNIHGVMRQNNKNISLKVESNRVEPSLEVTGGTISSNQKFTIKGKLVNKDTKNVYNNVQSEVKSEFLNEKYAIEKIVQNQDILLFERVVTAPSLGETTEFTIDFFGTYNTQNNEEFTFSTYKKITVQPPSKVIKIYHTLDKYTEDPDKAKVIVYVENLRDNIIKNVEVKELIPNILTVIEGQTSTSMTLEPKKKTQAYYYTVQALSNESAENNVETSVKYKETDKDFIVKQSLNLDIVGKGIDNKEVFAEVVDGDFDVIVEKKEEASNQNIQQNDQEQPQHNDKKKSIWQKIIDGLKWLFS